MLAGPTGKDSWPKCRCTSRREGKSWSNECGPLARCEGGRNSKQKRQGISDSLPLFFVLIASKSASISAETPLRTINTSDGVGRILRHHTASCTQKQGAWHPISGSNKVPGTQILGRTPLKFTLKWGFATSKQKDRVPGTFGRFEKGEASICGVIRQTYVVASV